MVDLEANGGSTTFLCQGGELSGVDREGWSAYDLVFREEIWVGDREDLLDAFSGDGDAWVVGFRDGDVRHPDAKSFLASIVLERDVESGFGGRDYTAIKRTLIRYDDRFADYWEFLEPRLAEAWRLLADTGTLYLHLDYREAH